MKYISIDSVVDAFNGCKGKTQNKFWGLLAIIKVIGQRIEPTVNYTFYTSKVSDFLEELFRLDDTKREYSTTAKWSVMFSKYWIENIPEQMFDNEPNIYDVATWFFRRTPFEDNCSSESIIEKLLDNLFISNEEAQSLFNFSKKTILFTSNLYKDSDLLLRLQKDPIEPHTISFEAQMFLKSHPGSLGQAPFVQTLYANQGIQKCLILTQFDFKEFYSLSSNENNVAIHKESLQRIYFGTPGSGKSWTIKKNYEQDERKVFRTTFHPDTDYASFVGCYKPVKDEDDDMKIVYKFVPQAFTDAYVAAWCDIEHPYYLIIEEINRGNCAQIFGDLFQLLDRNKDGYSEYPIKADHDLADYLMEHLPEDSEGIRDSKLCLPPNLSIIASMNTSDQSLFPMDSAFKRRWSWEYVPIDYENIESGAFTITIGKDTYNWHEFLKAVNKKIKAVTSSEDKQMGNFFIKSSIDEKEFCDKVMFYLWSEVGKDNYQTNDAIFRYYAEEDKLKEFSFNELYDQAKRTTILKGFVRYIEEEK